MLKETVRHEGGRPKDKPSHGGSVLPDGISYNQSSRWQKIAEVLEEKAPYNPPLPPIGPHTPSMDAIIRHSDRIPARWRAFHSKA